MPLLEVKNLSLRYDKAQILNGVSLAVGAGELVGWSAPTAPASRRCCARSPVWCASRSA